MKIIVEITEQDYRGLPSINSSECPIHKAIARVIPSIKFVVTRAKLLRTDYDGKQPHGQFDKDINWPDDMRQWIERYIQHDVPISPITFEIKIK